MRYWEKLAQLKSKPSEEDKIASVLGVYTGKGADGILQPDKPAMIDYSTGRPSIVHEGETVQDTPLGRYVTPAKAVPLNTETEQMQAMQAEKSLGLPGYQTGGYIQGYQTGGYMQPQTLNPNQQTQFAPPPQVNRNDPSPFQQQPTNLIQFPGTSQQNQKTISDSMNILKGVASGQNSVYDMQANQALGRLGASQAAGKAAQQQEIAQTGQSDQVAGVLGANLNRQNALQQGQVAQDIATTEAAAQVAAGKDLITTTLGLDKIDYDRQMEADRLVREQEKLDYERKNQDYLKTQGQISELLSLGGDENIGKATELASGLYGFGVDYSKAALPDIQASIGNIETWMTNFGADASPEMQQLMGKKYFELWNQSSAIQGLEFTPEERETILNGLVSGDTEAASSGLKLGASVMDWWDNGDGSPLKLMLSGQAKSYQDVLMNPNASAQQKEQASLALGEIVGAAYYAANGYSDYLTDAQRSMLDNAGLGIVSGTQMINKAKEEETKFLVDSYLAGTNTDWAAAYSQPEVWNKVKNVLRNVNPDATTWQTQSGKVGSRMVQVIDTFEGIDNNAVVNIGGKPFKLTAKGYDDYGKDYATYTFQDVATGNTININTKELLGKGENGIVGRFKDFIGVKTGEGSTFRDNLAGVIGSASTMGILTDTLNNNNISNQVNWS